MEKSLEEKRKENSKIPGTADWIKANLNKKLSNQEKVASYKESIMEMAKSKAVEQ
jgi:hypothetical protein